MILREFWHGGEVNRAVADGRGWARGRDSLELWLLRSREGIMKFWGRAVAMVYR